jgi:hypothetical protein
VIGSLTTDIGRLGSAATGVLRANTSQFVPKLNAITIPDTTPSPNATLKIFSQNSNTVRYPGRPVARHKASSMVSHAARPIVNDGKMMWNEILAEQVREALGHNEGED